MLTVHGSSSHLTGFTTLEDALFRFDTHLSEPSSDTLSHHELIFTRILIGVATLHLHAHLSRSRTLSRERFHAAAHAVTVAAQEMKAGGMAAVDPSLAVGCAR